MKESAFYAKIKAALTPLGWSCLRLENAVGAGWPDCNLCFRGHEAWVELKIWSGGRIELSPEQNAWAFREATHGRKVFLACYRPTHHQLTVWRAPYFFNATTMRMESTAIYDDKFTTNAFQKLLAP